MALIATTTSSSAHRPDQFTYAPADIVPDALILQTSTVSGNIEGDEPVLRVAYVDDDEAGFVAEGAPIEEADPDLAETIVATGKIGQLMRLSREQRGQNRTPELLLASLNRSILKAANTAYIRQAAPTAPAITPAAGLLNVPGVTDGGTVGANLDIISDALTAIEENGGTASHIIAAPSAWNAIRKLKTGTGSAQTLLGAGTGDIEKRLFGIPVLTSSAVPTGGLIALDQRAIVSAVGSVQVTLSEDRYFEYDSIGMRATWRFGANVVRPERIVKLTINADES